MLTSKSWICTFFSEKKFTCFFLPKYSFSSFLSCWEELSVSSHLAMHRVASPLHSVFGLMCTHLVLSAFWNTVSKSIFSFSFSKAQLISGSKSGGCLNLPLSLCWHKKGSVKNIKYKTVQSFWGKKAKMIIVLYWGGRGLKKKLIRKKW